MSINSTDYNKQLLDFGLFFLRIYLGSTMIFHGFPKLMNLFSGNKIEFISFLGLSPQISIALAVFAEVLCSFFIILGLFTRVALFPLIITMFVAVFIVHINDDFGKMELALIYFVSYLFLMISGPGKISVDAMTEKKQDRW